MNQTEADSVKDLAKPVVEALERVAEKECPLCGGSGIAPEHYDPPCEECSGTGKVKWKWEPKWGDKVICDNRKFIYCGISPYDSIEGDFIEDNGNQYYMDFEEVIPILHWEEIERVLEEAGHKTYTSVSDSGNVLCQICFPGRRKGRHNVMAKANGKSRQEAVMRSIIALGKKLGEEKHD